MRLFYIPLRYRQEFGTLLFPQSTLSEPFCMDDASFSAAAVTSLITKVLGSIDLGVALCTNLGPLHLDAANYTTAKGTSATIFIGNDRRRSFRWDSISGSDVDAAINIIRNALADGIVVIPPHHEGGAKLGTATEFDLLFFMSKSSTSPKEATSVLNTSSSTPTSTRTATENPSLIDSSTSTEVGWTLVIVICSIIGQFYLFNGLFFSLCATPINYDHRLRCTASNPVFVIRQIM